MREVSPKGHAARGWWNVQTRRPKTNTSSQKCDQWCPFFAQRFLNSTMLYEVAARAASKFEFCAKFAIPEE